MGQSQISIDNVFLAGWDDIYIYIPIKMATDEVVLRLHIQGLSASPGKMFHHKNHGGLPGKLIGSPASHV